MFEDLVSDSVALFQWDDAVYTPMDGAPFDTKVLVYSAPGVVSDRNSPQAAAQTIEKASLLIADVPTPRRGDTFRVVKNSAVYEVKHTTETGQWRHETVVELV